MPSPEVATQLDSIAAVAIGREGEISLLVNMVEISSG